MASVPCDSSASKDEFALTPDSQSRFISASPTSFLFRQDPMSPPTNANPVEARKRHATSAQSSDQSQGIQRSSSASHEPSPSQSPPRKSSSHPGESPVTLAFIALATVAVCLGIFFFIGLVGPARWPDAENFATITASQSNRFKDRLARSAPVLLAFYSETCPACRRMRRPFTAACSKLITADLPCYAIDLSSKDDASALAAQYGLKFVPSVFFAQTEEHRVLYNGGANAANLERFARTQLSTSSSKTTTGAPTEESNSGRPA